MDTPTSVQTLSAEHAIRLAEIFSALGDPSRLRILAALAQQPLNVGDLCQAVGLSQPAVSHHLRLLRVQRIVQAEKTGKYVVYRLADDHIHDLLERGMAHVQHT